MKQEQFESVANQRTRLLAALVEELKLPLLQIVHKSQLARLSNNLDELEDVETTAQASLRLIDSYLLTTQTLLSQQQLALQPVSVEATMHDTAQYLEKIAKLYDCEVAIKTPKRMGLVMAHPEGLRAALVALTYSFITGSTDKNKITLTARVTTKGVETGVLGRQATLKRSTLKQAQKLYGRARQPFSHLSHGSGAGIYVADSLFSAMSGSNLDVKRHNKSSGFYSVLVPSKQLALL